MFRLNYLAITKLCVTK